MYACQSRALPARSTTTSSVRRNRGKVSARSPDALETALASLMSRARPVPLAGACRQSLSRSRTHIPETLSVDKHTARDFSPMRLVAVETAVSQIVDAAGMLDQFCRSRRSTDAETKGDQNAET